ncbi:MAG: hypothetical protein KAJ40_06440, partial [Alphaproteobacteria bacterium]|nr:hypothetical protein [Alphaproteobacteria bacterium]
MISKKYYSPIDFPVFSMLKERGRSFSINAYDYRAICLFSACVVYALFGSPTPDHFGKSEIILFILLALSIGISNFRNILVHFERVRFWKSAGQVLFIYGFTVPLIGGAIAGNSLNAMLRDISPFLCLFLPFFCLSVIRARPNYFHSLLFGVILIGLFFGLRSLIMRFDISCRFDIWCINDGLLYLENMPTVLFSCL